MAEVYAGRLPMPIDLGDEDHWDRAMLDKYLDEIAGGVTGDWERSNRALPHNSPSTSSSSGRRATTITITTPARRAMAGGIYTRLPDLRDPKFGGALAACDGHRKRGVTEMVKVPKLIDLYQKSPIYRDLKPGSRKVYDIALAKLERLPTLRAS
jgi:hypothetical protein